MFARMILLAAFSVSSSLALAIDGSLDVQKGALKVVRTDGFKARFYQGKSPAQISFQNKKMYLTVTRKDVRTDAELKLPAGLSIPTNGDFTIDGVKAGQTFNVAGTIGTAVTDSPTYEDFEACTYYRREWVCDGYYEDQYCRWEDVPVQGSRRVEYHLQTKTVTLAIDLVSPGEGNARFDGRESSTKKIYTYEGRCR